MADKKIKILNIMLGKKRGGLEQAATDYHEALVMQGHAVLSVMARNAWAGDLVRGFGGDQVTLDNMGEWDPLAAMKLSAIAKKFGADMAICHGNRAIGIALKALKGKCPVTAVAHNYNTKRFPKCDAAFCITEDLVRHLGQHGMAKDSLFHMPNMVRIKDRTFHPGVYRIPPVIASMGRLVEKKGFEVYIRALGVLAREGLSFRAVLGGDGELETDYRALAGEQGLDGILSFTGWVGDKDSFFAETDIFVLPSHHEPFGIVLIEAMAAGLPCITTDTEGPVEIVTDRTDALMVRKDNVEELAAAMKELLQDSALAGAVARGGFDRVLGAYDIAVVGKRLGDYVCVIQ